jgi:CRP-like cAMP-binding protein
MLDILHETAIFHGLGADEYRLLEGLFEEIDCPAGTTIFEQGGSAEYLYLLLKGTVRIGYKPYDGPPITITHIQAGDVFGWSAVVGTPLYSSGAITDEPCTILRTRGAALRTLCLQQPEIGAVILDRLANKVSSRWSDAREQVRQMLEQVVHCNGSDKKGARI